MGINDADRRTAAIQKTAVPSPSQAFPWLTFLLNNMSKIRQAAAALPSGLGILEDVIGVFTHKDTLIPILCAISMGTILYLQHSAAGAAKIEANATCLQHMQSPAVK